MISIFFIHFTSDEFSCVGIHSLQFRFQINAVIQIAHLISFQCSLSRLTLVLSSSMFALCLLFLLLLTMIVVAVCQWLCTQIHLYIESYFWYKKCRLKKNLCISVVHFRFTAPFIRCRFHSICFSPYSFFHSVHSFAL